MASVFLANLFGKIQSVSNTQMALAQLVTIMHYFPEYINLIIFNISAGQVNFFYII